MTTTSGFSSRSTDTTISQLPQRDEAAMSDLQPGFSNSDPAEDEPSDNVSAKVVDSSTVEDKAIKPDSATTKKRSSSKR